MAKKFAGNASDLVVVIPETVASWQAQGAFEGKRIMLAESNVELLAACVAVIYGEKLGGQPAAADFLTGYASNWTNPDTAKSRKSNLKTVFDCFAFGTEERKMLIGFDAGGGMVHGVKKVSEWLKGHNEIEVELVKGRKARLYSGYSGLLRLAKALKGGASNTATATTTVAARLTDKQLAEFITRLPAASANQSAQVAEKATAGLLKLPQFEIAMFQQISMICNMMKAKSNDLHFLKVAGDITDIVNVEIDRVRAEEAKMLAQANKGGITEQNPAPSPAPVPAETVNEEAKAA